MPSRIKLTIELELRQVMVILDALDMLMRVGMGQVKIVEEFLRLHGDFDSDTLSAFRAHLEGAASVLFGMPVNTFWSIRNVQVPLVAREAYDIYQVLRKALYDFNHRDVAVDERPHSTWASPYMASNPEWPKVEVSIEESS